MENFLTTISFISSDFSGGSATNNALTGDFILLCAIALLVLLLLISSIYFLHKKNYRRKLINHTNGVSFMSNKIIMAISFIMGISLMVAFCTYFATVAKASDLGFSVSSNINADVKVSDNEVNIDNVNIRNQTQNEYRINQISINLEEGLQDDSNWTLASEGLVIYSGQVTSKIILQTPIVIQANSTLNISVSSDINVNNALNYVGKNSFSITFGICKIGNICNLEVNDKVCPNDVSDRNVIFGWQIDNDAIGIMQSAYQISVIDSNGNVIYDSNKVEGEIGKDSTNVKCEISGLKSSEKYSWLLNVWDNYNNQLHSQTSNFQTALLEANPMSEAQYLSFNDPRLIDNDDRATKNFAIDYDIIHEQTESKFAFCLDNRKNYVYVHLYKDSENENFWCEYGYLENGVKKIINSAVFAGINYSEQVLNKITHVKIESVYNQNDTSQTVTTSINLEGGAGPISTNPTVLPIQKNLNKIGIFSDVHSQTFVAKYSNIIMKNPYKGTGDEGIVYDNDFSSGRLGFYHDYSAYITNEEDGSFWLRVGTTTPDSNWGEEPLVEYYNEDGNFPVFRDEFSVDKQISYAKLYTAGLGAYDCFINGQRIFDNTLNGAEYYELKSNYTEYQTSRFYLTFDVTPLLQNGANAISAITSDSWWSDKINGWLGVDDAFKCQLFIKFSDGTSKVLNSNTDTWKTSAASPMYRAEMFSGECYDARVDTSWKNVGFDDSTWLNPKLNTEKAGQLMAWIGEKIQVRDDLILEPKSIITYSGETGAVPGERYGNIANVVSQSGSFTLQPGQTALIDFGQNSAGWENFTVNGQSGTKLTIRHAEILNEEDGIISRANFGPGGSASYYNLRSCKATTEYVLAGSGSETYHPTLSYYGFRYLEITTNATVTLSNITSLVLTSVKNDAGYIKTNDDKLNKLISNAKWGMYSNYLGVPTDCPQRDERQGWTADAQVFAETAMFMADNKSFLEKFCHDIRDAQNRKDGNGIFPATAPFSEWGGNAWGATGWADCGVIVPYTLYCMYGDISVLQDSWDSMDWYVRTWIPTQDSDDSNLPHRGPTTMLGDWHVPDSEHLNTTEIKNVIACEYYCWDLQMMTNAAKVLNKDQSIISYYENKYSEIKQWFNQHFCNNGSLVYPESQTVAAYALYLDLIEDSSVRANTIDALENNIHEFGDKLKTGFLGTRVLLDALAKINRYDLAYKILTSEENPGWLFTVNNGATTFWERWDSYDKSKGFYQSSQIDYTNSFNHYSYGAVVSWMYRNMLGINCSFENAGFNKVTLAPYPAIQQYNNININHVEGSYKSIYGNIFVDSSYIDGVWKYCFTTPSNTSTELMIPKIFDSFKLADKNIFDLNFDEDGAVIADEDNQYYILEVKCGSFVLECAK